MTRCADRQNDKCADAEFYPEPQHTDDPEATKQEAAMAETVDLDPGGQGASPSLLQRSVKMMMGGQEAAVQQLHCREPGQH